MSITMQQQADAVARAAVNLRGHYNNLAELAPKGRRPLHELDEARRWLPALQAAAVTLAKLARRSNSVAALTEGLD